MKNKLVQLVLSFVVLLGVAHPGSWGQPLSSSMREASSGTILGATYVGQNQGLGRLDVHWLSTAGGILDATINQLNSRSPVVSGTLVRVDFVPFLADPPTNNYACTITGDMGGTSSNSTPLLAAVNLSSATRQTYGVTAVTVDNVHTPAYMSGPLAIEIAGAGSSKRGTIRFYFVRY
jgi:hypothetical protein